MRPIPRVSTHSRLKAAGTIESDICMIFSVSTHSRLKAAGWEDMHEWLKWKEFQHTAA